MLASQMNTDEVMLSGPSSAMITATNAVRALRCRRGDENCSWNSYFT
ncbi:hypothetical protein [Nocardia sp. CNY236]|nr:hypothetical protein [Nocardia sp. CNY236]